LLKKTDFLEISLKRPVSRAVNNYLGNCGPPMKGRWPVRESARQFAKRTPEGSGNYRLNRRRAQRKNAGAKPRPIPDKPLWPSARQGRRQALKPRSCPRFLTMPPIPNNAARVPLPSRRWRIRKPPSKAPPGTAAEGSPRHSRRRSHGLPPQMTPSGADASAGGKA
jgi:hypothetical protein